MKISRKYRKKLENVGKNREIEISVEIFYRSPPKTEISAKIFEIFFLAYSWIIAIEAFSIGSTTNFLKLMHNSKE